MKKRDESFLENLESEHLESSHQGAQVEDSRPNPSGARRAAQLSRNDDYRLAKINILDIAGWVLTLLILWAVYTVISGFFSSEATPVQKPKLTKEQILERRKLKAAMVRHERKRVQNSEAFSSVESRLADIISEEEKVVEEAVVEEERRSQGGFRLGVAIQRLLIKDGQKPDESQ